jgi:hypothetical protein
MTKKNNNKEKKGYGLRTEKQKQNKKIILSRLATQKINTTKEFACM